MKIDYKLAEAIERCTKFTRQGVFVTDFSYLCFKEKAISAYNGFSGIIHIMSEGFSEDVVVPGDMINKLIHSLESDLEITKKSGGDGQTLQIKSKGKFISKFAVPSVDNNLWNFNLPDSQVMKLLDKEFFPCLRKVYFSVCKDETRPNYKGIYCDGEYVYSTDNFRISRFPFKFEGAKGLVISDQLLDLIIGEKSPAGYSLTGENEKKLWLIFEEGQFLVFGNAYNLKFPDCSGPFSVEKSKEEVEFSPDEFMKVLVRFENLNPTWPQKVYLVAKPSNELFIMTNTSTIEATEKISCSTTLEKPRACAVNLKYLKDVVENTNHFSIENSWLYFSFKPKAPVDADSGLPLEESEEQKVEREKKVGLESLLLFLDPVNEEELVKKADESI